MEYAELYLSESRKCINDSACNLAEYGFMFFHRHAAECLQCEHRGEERIVCIKFMTLHSPTPGEKLYFFKQFFLQVRKATRSASVFAIVAEYLEHGKSIDHFCSTRHPERQSLKLQVTRQQIHGRQRGYERNKSYQIYVRSSRRR